MSSSESDLDDASLISETSDEEIDLIKEVKSSKSPQRNKVLPAKLSETAEEQKERPIDDETSNVHADTLNW